MAKKTSAVFVRDATGLVKAFSAKDMLAFNLYGTNWGIVLALTVLTGVTAFPGANMSLAVTVGLCLVVFDAIMNSQMSAAIPRSGSYFVWLSYILNPAVGFIFSWMFMLNIAFAIGLYAGLTANFGVSAAFATLGILLQNPTLTNIGTAAATPNWVFIIGTAAIWGSIVIFEFGSRAIKYFMWIIMVPCIIGAVLGLGVLLTATHASFVTAFNAAMTPYTNSTNSYQAIINTATSAGGTIPAYSVAASVTALPLGYWAYVGYNQSVWGVGGEVKNPSKSQPIAVLTSLFLTWAVYAFAFQRFYDIAGWNFTNAVGYLFNVAPSQYVLPVPPTMNFFIGLLTNNVLVNVLIGISFILWIFMLVGPSFLTTSRYMFAWSFSRVLPEVFAKVDSRGTPWASLLLSGILAEIFLALYAFTSVLGLVNYTITYAIVFLVVGLAASLFPFRKKDTFESAPGFVKARLGGFPVLTIFGIIDMILFGAIFIISLENPAFSGPLGLSSYALILTMFFSGVLIYVVAYLARKKQGIDFSMISKEIPPE
ncbi:MAG: APC family permease [Candidatus Bathyarchaeia archaeon]